MGKKEKVLLKVLRGTSDANISFNDLCLLLRRLDFAERIKGSHHIFSRSGVEEILNLQPKRGKAKVYQVKQVRNIILRYKLADEGYDE
ncbi:MAG: type II toxin-antitoxin system HicA family toxin [Chloroflexi bacterium]|nr:type II toxin-antitoxin system HicA family toxin [Chloroflexota bacterium]